MVTLIKNRQFPGSAYPKSFVKLNPAVGSEIQKTDPVLLSPPDEMNLLQTVIVALLTSRSFDFVFRPGIDFQK